MEKSKEKRKLSLEEKLFSLDMEMKYSFLNIMSTFKKKVELSYMFARIQDDIDRKEKNRDFK